MNWPEGPDKNHETLSRDASFESFTVVIFSGRGLLRCGAMWCCGGVPTFQRFMLPPFCHTLHGVTTQNTSVSVMRVGAVAEIRIVYLPRTN
jgi:hypothetical protein